MDVKVVCFKRYVVVRCSRSMVWEFCRMRDQAMVSAAVVTHSTMWNPMVSIMTC